MTTICYPRYRNYFCHFNIGDIGYLHRGSHLILSKQWYFGTFRDSFTIDVGDEMVTKCCSQYWTIVTNLKSPTPLYHLYCIDCTSLIDSILQPFYMAHLFKIINYIVYMKLSIFENMAFYTKGYCEHTNFE